MSDFAPADAVALYNIDRWGGGYFHINHRGHVVARPNTKKSEEIDLMEVVAEAR